MHILILSWRDRKNPMSGGAEVLTDELARRLVLKGNRVTLFTSMFSGALGKESIHGVDVIRKGKWWNVQIWAFIYYLFIYSSDVDVVIDEVHWFPFFSVVYARKKVVILVCEVARRFFFRLFPYPLALFGRAVEKLYFFLYGFVPVLTISHSTKNDLVHEGLDKDKIRVLPMGLTVPTNIKQYEKEKVPTFLFVGRLHPFKGVIDAIEAFAIIHHDLPRAKFWIVGTGNERYVDELQDRIRELQLTEHVHLFGYVSEKIKFTLYQKAHVLVVPSFHEGWGLVVAEASSQGTPSVAYNTAGLRDVIVDGMTGILVKDNTPVNLAISAEELYKDKILYEQLKQSGIKYTKEMSWDKTTSSTLALLQTIS